MHYNSFSTKGYGGVALAVILSAVLLGPALLIPAHAATTNTLTVRAYTTGGDALSMYAVIKSGSTTVKTGFTPLTYTGTTGNTYSVQVQNYNDLTFSKWGNGSTSNPRTITLWGDTTTVAYFNKGTTTMTSTSSTSTLTVRATTTGSDSLSMYTTIKSGSTTVKTGFTPLTYTGTTGKSYTVTMSDYNDLTFSNWGSGSGSSNPRTITLSDDMTVTAYYNKGTTTTTTSGSTGTSSLIPKTGVMVALYMYPGSTGSVHWQKVIDEKQKHPSVPIVAIFNPSSGPGSSKNSNIAYWVDKLQDAGVIAIGYIPDGYADTKNPGSKTMTWMKDKIKKYDDWYGADGVYFDEMTNKAGYESRYRDLTAYAKSLGMKMTAANPGTDVPPSYIGTLTVIKTSEGRGYISVTDPNIIGSSWVKGGYTGWHKDYDKRNFAIVRYDADWLNKTFVADVSRYMGLVYVTSGDDSDGRWFKLPSYFGDLVATLDR